MRNKTERDHVRKYYSTHFYILLINLLLFRIAEPCVSIISCLVYSDIFTTKQTYTDYTYKQVKCKGEAVPITGLWGTESSGLLRLPHF